MEAQNAEYQRFLSILKPVWNPISNRHYFKALKIMAYFSTRLGDISPAMQYWVSLCGAYTMGETPSVKDPKDFMDLINIMKNARTLYPEHLCNQKALLQEAKEHGYHGDACNGFIYLYRCQLTKEKDEEATSIESIQKRCRSFGIVLNPVPGANLSTDDECAICHEPLGRQCKHAAQLLTKNVASISGSEWSEIAHLIVDCKECVFTEEEEEDEEFFKAMMQFIRQIALVYPRYKNLKQENQGCKYAVTTECGHTFGLQCIDAWIQQNGKQTTCPYCRTKLAKERPAIKGAQRGGGCL